VDYVINLHRELERLEIHDPHVAALAKLLFEPEN
jgi:hypothetical protein